MYDTNNIFARILRGEIPCKKIAQGDYFLSFNDNFTEMSCQFHWWLFF